MYLIEPGLTTRTLSTKMTSAGVSSEGKRPVRENSNLTYIGPIHGYIEPQWLNGVVIFVL
jgi:hypothetical protein